MSRKAEIYKELHDLQVNIDKIENFRLFGNPNMKIIFEESLQHKAMIFEFEDEPDFVKAMQDDLVQKYKRKHDELLIELRAIDLEENPFFERF